MTLIFHCLTLHRVKFPVQRSRSGIEGFDTYYANIKCYQQCKASQPYPLSYATFSHQCYILIPFIHTLCFPFVLCMLLIPRGTREFIMIQQNIKLSLASRKEHLFHIPKSLPRISEQAVLFCFLIEREFHVYSKHKNSEHCSIWANITSAISWQRSSSIGLLPLGREQEG